MTEKRLDIVELFIDSVTEHGASKHLEHLRNEDKGKALIGTQSKGTPLSAFDKEDFRQHLRQTLSDPNTRYFIDESNGRMMFFNADEANRSRIVLSPAQFNKGKSDGHAGTLMRDALAIGDESFDEAVKAAAKNMNGIAPEISSVSDGKWVDHLENYRTQLENVPARVLGKGDLRTDYHRADGQLKAESLRPLDYNAPNAPSILGKYGGTVTGLVVSGLTATFALTSGSSTAQAAGVFYETAVPYGEAQTKVVQGDMQGAMQAAVVETASNMAFGACATKGAVLGAAGGTAILPIAGTAIGGGAGFLAAGVTCAVGAGMATDYALDHAASVTQRQAIYDALPVLDVAANDGLYDESNPIHAYPAAHDMALIKTQIVGTQGMIERVNDGTKEPFNGMNKGESVNFLQDRIVRLDDRFTETYNQAKADGTLDDVIAYASQYGVENMQAAQQQDMALRNTQAANNTTYTAHAFEMR